MRQLTYSVLPGHYAICRLPPGSAVPSWASSHSEFSSITRDSAELSIVCPESRVPPELKASRAWLCLKLHGPFPFSETGILLSFIQPLSERGIPIFAVSTFDTDFVLIENKSWPLAAEVLRAAGHHHLAD